MPSSRAPFSLQPSSLNIAALAAFSACALRDAAPCQYLTAPGIRKLDCFQGLFLQGAAWDSEEAIAAAVCALKSSGGPLWRCGRVLLQLGCAGAAELQDGAIQRLWLGEVHSSRTPTVLVSDASLELHGMHGRRHKC
jgi:hypothetical protein